MCPESLREFARGSDAKVGDQITIKKFAPPNHTAFTMYARVSEPGCPICLPSGSAVQFASLPDVVARRVGRNPGMAVLQNGFAYESTFLFSNGETASISALIDAVGQVIPSVAEIDHEANRIMDAASRRIEAEQVRAGHGQGELVGATHQTASRRFAAAARIAVTLGLAVAVFWP